MINVYCTLADIKQSMPDANWTAGSDATINSLISRVSRSIDSFCKRLQGAFFVNADTIRYFTGSGTDELLIDEMAAAPTSVEVDENVSGSYVAWASTDYIGFPFNALADGRPYTSLIIDPIFGTKKNWPTHMKSTKITGKFGYSIEVPEDIKEVAVIQTVRLFQRGKAGFQPASAIIELGQLAYTKLDPDVQQFLEGAGYIRVTI